MKEIWFKYKFKQHWFCLQCPAFNGARIYPFTIENPEKAELCRYWCHRSRDDVDAVAICHLCVCMNERNGLRLQTVNQVCV